ncbi:MAG: tetratricopeptide repeat protein [Candidatus Omnitrophota bacterium]
MKRRNKSVIWFLIFNLFSAPCAYGVVDPSYQNFMAEARAAFDNNDYVKALFYIQSAQQADRSSLEPFELSEQIPPLTRHYKSLNFFFNLATKYYYKGDYQSARFYYEKAYAVDPSVPGLQEMADHADRVILGMEPPLFTPREPVFQDIETDPVVAGRLSQEETKQGRRYAVPHNQEVEDIIAKYQGQSPEHKKSVQAVRTPDQEDKIHVLSTTDQTPQQYRKTFIPVAAGRKMPVTQIPRAMEKDTVAKETEYSAYQRKKAVILSKQEERLASTNKETIAAQEMIELDAELWSQQPGTVLEIEFGKSVILHGRQVQQFLVFDPDMLIAQRMDNDSVLITVQQRGSTLFHLWDGQGRWTFNVKGVLPEIQLTKAQMNEDHLEKHVRPFRVSYANNWNSFYLGQSIPELERRNLSFTQWVGVYGETPHGFLDASGNFFKFDESTENTGRTVGLSNANLGPFEDFSIRGWDASKRFSNLSLPGRSFRGILFDSYTLDRNVQFTYLKGQDRANFRQISEGTVEVRKSYIEGGRITLFPDQENKYSINYARGHGEERPKTLKDKVFSVEAVNKFGAVDTHFEVAWDEQDFGELLLTKYEQDDLVFRVNVRDLNPGFKTITSRPSGAGEVGGNIVFEYSPEEYSLSSNLDIYRDRDLANPEKPNSVNYDFGTVFGMPLTDTLSWNNSFFYSNTPQIVSPHESLRFNTTLTKSFEIFNQKTITAFLGGSIQRSRYDRSSSAEYDRMGLSLGVRFPIVKNLNFFSSYDYSWVDVLESGEMSQPNVMNTGLSYYQSFGSKLSGRLSTTYRNEEDTDADFSFLSGTDTLRHNIGFSYRPSPEVEIFMDGSIRNVWRENPEREAYNDADIRVGMRTSWETIFRWDPTATITGTVYKDLNRNSKQDADEPGLEGIEIQLGRKTVKTNYRGRYSSKVRAQEVKVGVNFDSVPKGYSLLSYLMKDIHIENGRTYTIDFGFITRSGIFGVFFVDENNNGKYEDGEKTVARARLKLDGREVAESDFEGVYHFYDVKPGEHSLVIDINSLPMEYLPVIKIKNNIDIQEGTTFTFHIPLKRK